METYDDMIVEFDDTHLYRDERGAYLMELADNSKSDVEYLVLSGFIELYSLGKADFYFDLYAMEAKNRICFIPNLPS